MPQTPLSPLSHAFFLLVSSIIALNINYITLWSPKQKKRDEYL